jgi:acyl-CoA thioesterase
MKHQQLAEEIVNKMYTEDGFAAWMGVEVVKIEPGHVILQMKVRREMLNGFHTCHGGILFSLADTALAFASNSHGRLSVLAEANISYPESVHEGEILMATAVELSVKNRIAIYNVNITKEDNIKVALFRGTVYRTNRHFSTDQDPEKLI